MKQDVLGIIKGKDDNLPSYFNHICYDNSMPQIFCVTGLPSHIIMSFLFFFYLVTRHIYRHIYKCINIYVVFSTEEINIYVYTTCCSCCCFSFRFPINKKGEQLTPSIWCRDRLFLLLIIIKILPEDIPNQE